MLSERLLMAASGQLNWLPGWDNRIELTINNSNVDEDLSDFPVLVHLSTISGITDTDVSAVFDELTSDANRKKIAVTSSDGISQLYVEIERWDNANEKAWLWVKAPTVSLDIDTVLYLYYDVDHADNTTYVGDTGDTPAKNVWDSNFVGVWHMAQDPNEDAANVMKDSTTNENHGTPAGSMTTADLVDGKVGKGIDFDGSNDKINCGHDASLDVTTGLTAEICIKTGERYQTLLGKYNQDVSKRAWVLRDDFFVISEDSSYNTAWRALLVGDNLNDNIWHHVVGQWTTGEKAKLYLDGDFNGESSGTVTDIHVIDTDVEIARSLTDSGDTLLNGIGDEVRISDIARSAAWIKATYYSNWDNLITFSAPYLPDWDNRIKLTIDNSNVDEDLSDFPVLVHLSTTSGITDTNLSGIFDELASDANRKKIAVTSSDGLTQLYVEIERWDNANEKAWLWVKILGIDSTADTVLYLYYNADHVDNTTYVGDTGDTPAKSVWDSNFKGVWHMAQDPNGDVPNAIKDSTINTNHGTPDGSMTSADLVDGKIGKGIDFDGNDAIDIGDVSMNFGTGGLTLETIFKTPDSATNRMVIARQDDLNEHMPLIQFFINATGQVHFVVRGQTNPTSYITFTSNGADYDDNTLRYVAGIFDDANDSGEIWVNESSDGTVSSETTTDVDFGQANLQLGRTYQGWVPSGGNYFTGILDEIRISNIARSAAWIKATYYSNWDNLITFSAPWLSDWDNRIKLTIDNSNVDEDLSDFPVLVHLSTTSGITDTDVSAVFDELKSNANRKKIAVTNSDGLTELYVEIERWDDANEKAWLWVKTPDIDSTADTVLYLYYDADQANNTSYIGDTGDGAAQNVWDDNFVGVWHMAQDPDETQTVLYAPEVVGTTANPSLAQQGFGAIDCTGLTKANGMLKVELKASDSAIITLSSFEITSSGTYNSEEWAYTLTTAEKARLLTIYQIFYFPLSDFITTGGELQVDQIDYIRWWASTTGANVTIHWKNAEVIWPANTILDSTINGNHGTPGGSTTTADLVDGKIGKALDFDGLDDYITIPDLFDSDPSEITFEIIFNADSTSSEFRVLSYNNDGFYFTLRINQGAAANKIYTFVYDGEVDPIETEAYDVTSYRYVVVSSREGGNTSLYVDNTLVGQDGGIGSFSATDNLGRIIGADRNAAGGYFDGIIDEVRSSKTERSVAWCKATYYSNWDSLITFSTPV